MTITPKKLSTLLQLHFWLTVSWSRRSCVTLVQWNLEAPIQESWPYSQITLCWLVKRKCMEMFDTPAAWSINITFVCLCIVWTDFPPFWARSEAFGSSEGVNFSCQLFSSIQYLLACASELESWSVKCGFYHWRVWGESQRNEIHGVSWHFSYQRSAIGRPCFCVKGCQEAHVVFSRITVLWFCHAHFAHSATIPRDIHLWKPKTDTLSQRCCCCSLNKKIFDIPNSLQTLFKLVISSINREVLNATVMTQKNEINGLRVNSNSVNNVCNGKC